MTYKVTSKIMPNAKLPLDYVKNTFDKRNKIAKQKSIEFYKNITNECKDGVYSISRIRKCIDNLFAPNKINYTIKSEEREQFSGSIANILSVDKERQILQYDGIALFLPLKKNKTEVENKYTLFHEVRHMIDYLYNPKVKMHRINNLINNEGYSNATDYINKIFMEEISSKTNMKEFRKEASDLIDILPRDIAIETLQKIRSHLITEINAYSDEIHFRFKSIKNIDDFIDALNLKLSYKLNFKFEDKLKFANKKLNALLKEERASLKNNLINQQRKSL